VTERSETDEFGRRLYSEDDRAKVKRVTEIAAKRGINRAQVALAWIESKPAVTAPIVGMTKPAQLADALASVELKLTPEEIEQLEEPYEPHRIAGH
jgi:aryl-alcohol dehydrogenase (NADP+)